VDVTISSPTGGALIYYTTDGSPPLNGVSPLYSARFNVTQSTVVRAVAYSGTTPSNEASSRFLIGNLPSTVTAFSGLAGTYYDSADFGGSSTLRLDASINKPELHHAASCWQGECGQCPVDRRDHRAVQRKPHLLPDHHGRTCCAGLSNNLVIDDWAA